MAGRVQSCRSCDPQGGQVESYRWLNSVRGIHVGAPVRESEYSPMQILTSSKKDYWRPIGSCPLGVSLGQSDHSGTVLAQNKRWNSMETAVVSDELISIMNSLQQIFNYPGPVQSERLHSPRGDPGNPFNKFIESENLLRNSCLHNPSTLGHN